MEERGFLSSSPSSRWPASSTLPYNTSAPLVVEALSIIRRVFDAPPQQGARDNGSNPFALAQASFYIKPLDDSFGPQAQILLALTSM